MSSIDFQETVSEHLKSRGLSASGSRQIAEWLDQSLDFKVDRAGDDNFDAYVCFAFGNEPDEIANLDSGMLNEQLAEVVKQKYLDNPKPIIAQWEIGSILIRDDDIKGAPVTSVGQKFDRVHGRPIYQSTRSFMTTVADHFKGERKKLSVIAQWFHYARCVREVESALNSRGERAEFVAITDQDSMSRSFCTQNFGQLWTSSEERFVLHTLIGSLNFIRDNLNREWLSQNSG